MKLLKSHPGLPNLHAPAFADLIRAHDRLGGEVRLVVLAGVHILVVVDAVFAVVVVVCTRCEAESQRCGDCADHTEQQLKK